jgi:hypothetical protein
MVKFIRNCPICDRVLEYTNERAFFTACTRNTNCKSCSGKIRPKISEDTRLKLIEKNTGNNNPMFGRTGKSCPSFGRIKIVSPETKSRMSLSHIGITHTTDSKRKIAITKLGKPRTPETRHKIRMAKIKQLEFTHGQISPAYNPTACRYFDWLAEHTGTHIQHAENGGEFYIKELGYWVDDYDAENNVVYEFDERYHQSERQHLRDIQRQAEIEHNATM